MKKKFINIVLSVFLIVLTLILVGCSQLTNNNELHVDKIQEKGIRLSSKRMLNTNESINITASIYPTNAENKYLNWELSWENSPNNLNISDYVTHSVSSDSLSCSFTYIQNFNNKIIVTVTSVMNSDIKATAYLSCYSRTYDIKDGIIKTYDNNSNSMINNQIEIGNKDDLLCLLWNCNYASIFGYGNAEIEIGNINFYKNGIVNTTTTYTTKLILNQSIYQYLMDNGISIKTDNISFNGAIVVKNALEEMINFNSSNRETIYELLSTIDNWFDIQINVTDKYYANVINTSCYTIKLFGFDLSDRSNFLINSISLNQSEFIM